MNISEPGSRTPSAQRLPQPLFCCWHSSRGTIPMRLFISNSDSAAMKYAKWLCVVCVVFAIGTESLSNVLLKRHSVTYRRVSEQVAEAAAAQRSTAGQPMSVMMIGNSLLLDGVQV